MINKQSGFSLVEFFVALMLMGILGVAGMEMLSQQNKSQVMTEGNFDAIDLVSEVRTVMSSPQSCTTNFRGKNYSNGTALTELKRAIKDPATGAYSDAVYLALDTLHGARIKIKTLKLINVDTAKGTAALEIVSESVGSNVKTYTKTIPLTILTDINTPSLIDSCVAVGGPPIDPVEMCSFTGGAYNESTSKCQVSVDLDTGQLPSYCPPGSSITFETVSGKPRMKCNPCTPYEKYDHYECGKPFSGMNWVNKCYYRTVCANNHAIELFPVHWDQKVGPTGASGGDTGSKRNCRKKRHNCPGQ
jgi:type II secretory pathway pseudopilin PulG